MISPPREVKRRGIFVTVLAMTATVGGVATSVAARDEVTFTRDVAPILYDNSAANPNNPNPEDPGRF